MNLFRLAPCVFLAATFLSGKASALSWHDIKGSGRTSVIVILTALSTYYLSYKQLRSNVPPLRVPDDPFDEDPEWPRQPPQLSDNSLRKITQMLSTDGAYDHFNRTLDAICVERRPGTPAHAKVRQFIIDELTDLDWGVEEHSFTSNTPHGKKPFTNIIATLDPKACHRIVLACHYDTLGTKKNFEGAIDSAVPCTQMIHFAKVFDKQLKQQRNKDTGLTLQLIFFDGEEAFNYWTDDDSLYGSRKLAESWHTTKFLYSAENKCTKGDKEIITELDRIEIFILLDLLGSANPRIPSYFPDTKSLHSKMGEFEQRLNKLSLMEGHTRYISGSTASMISDDHLPFLRRDVPILHIIPSPFPVVWHNERGLEDNKENLDRPTINNLNRIFASFLVWYLEL